MYTLDDKLLETLRRNVRLSGVMAACGQRRVSDEPWDGDPELRVRAVFSEDGRYHAAIQRVGPRIRFGYRSWPTEGGAVDVLPLGAYWLDEDVLQQHALDMLLDDFTDDYAVVVRHRADDSVCVRTARDDVVVGYDPHGEMDDEYWLRRWAAALPERIRWLLRPLPPEEPYDPFTEDE